MIKNALYYNNIIYRVLLFIINNNIPHRKGKNYGTLRPNMGNYKVQSELNMYLEDETEYPIMKNRINFKICNPNDRDNCSYWNYWDNKCMNTDIQNIRKKDKQVLRKKDRKCKNELVQ